MYQKWEENDNVFPGNGNVLKINSGKLVNNYFSTTIVKVYSKVYNCNSNYLFNFQYNVISNLKIKFYFIKFFETVIHNF